MPDDTDTPNTDVNPQPQPQPQQDSPIDQAFLSSLGLSVKSDIAPPKTSPQPQFVSDAAAAQSTPDLNAKKSDDPPKPAPSSAQPIQQDQSPAKQPLDSPIDKAIGAKQRAQRDYTGLDENETEIFKNMSRSAYDRLYPLYLREKANGNRLEKFEEIENELKTLKAEKAKPPTYYDHPEAYFLDESYRKALAQKGDLADRTNFWQEQLAAVEAGKPFKIIQQDPATGALSLSTPYQPSPEAKAYVLRQLNESQIAYAQQVQQIGQIKEAITQNYKSYSQKVDLLFDKLFGRQKDFLAKHAEKELELIDPAFHGRPEIKLLTHALAALRIIADASQNPTAEGKKVDAAAAQLNAQLKKQTGPSANQIQSGPTGKPNSNPFQIDKDEMKRLRSEGLLI